MFLLPPPPVIPRVRLLDLRSDPTAKTIYSFTDCCVAFPPSGQLIGDARISQNIHRGRANLYAIIHGKDDAITYGVSGATFGGVAGTELIDRNGATNAINTAIYRWAPFDLGAIANTTLEVTFTEAILGCAVGLVLVENLWLGTGDTGTGTGTTNAASSVFTPTTTYPIQHTLVLWGASSVVANNAEALRITDSTSGNPSDSEKFVLYESGDAVMSYAAGYTILEMSGAGTTSRSHATIWGGTANGHDHVLVALQ